MKKILNLLACAAVTTTLLAGAVSAPVFAGKKAAANRQTRENREIKVTMYMTSWCPYCKQAREHLKSLGVSLVEYDIEENDARRREMKKLSGGSTMVPLINVEGIVISGFVPEEIDEAVEKRRHNKK